MDQFKQLEQLLRARLDQQEQMLTTLIQMQKTTNQHIEQLKQDVTASKDLLHTFRSETNVNFAKLDRRIKLIESDLDATMIQVEELQAPQN